MYQASLVCPSPDSSAVVCGRTLQGATALRSGSPELESSLPVPGRNHPGFAPCTWDFPWLVRGPGAMSIRGNEVTAHEPVSCRFLLLLLLQSEHVSHCVSFISHLSPDTLTHSHTAYRRLWVLVPECASEDLLYGWALRAQRQRGMRCCVALKVVPSIGCIGWFLAENPQALRSG